MKTTFIRTAYNYDMNKAGDEDALNCTDKTLTHQSFAEECDINTIVRRFNLTGQLPDNITAPEYRDYEDVNDYHTAMNAIKKANAAFEEMPADIRYRFNNDPGTFVDFCSDERNRDELRKMGLIPPEPPGSPVPSVPSVPSGAAGAAGAS